MINWPVTLFAFPGTTLTAEIEVKYTGLRPGEKLFEELITACEGIDETSHEKIMVLYGNGVTYSFLNHFIGLLTTASEELDGNAIRLILRELIPEYSTEIQVESVHRQLNEVTLL